MVVVVVDCRSQPFSSSFIFHRAQPRRRARSSASSSSSSLYLGRSFSHLTWSFSTGFCHPPHHRHPFSFSSFYFFKKLKASNGDSTFFSLSLSLSPSSCFPMGSIKAICSLSPHPTSLRPLLLLFCSKCRTWDSRSGKRTRRTPRRIVSLVAVDVLECMQSEKKERHGTAQQSTGRSHSMSFTTECVLLRTVHCIGARSSSFFFFFFYLLLFFF